MAHELDINNGIASFADSRTDAWHQLGQQIGRTMTVEEALEAAHLANWNIRKIPAYGMDPATGEMVAVPDRWATIRDNPVTGEIQGLGTVGNRYTPVQNEELGSFLNALVDESGAHIETAGALRGGREVFLSTLLPSYMEFSGRGSLRDDVDVYITVLDSKDGASSLTVIVTPVRVVCKNTQTIALSTAPARFHIRHTPGATKAVEEARQTLGLAFRHLDAFGEEMQKLIDRELDGEGDARRLIESVFGIEEGMPERQKNIRTEHVDNVLSGLWLPTNAGFEHTRYGLYNAVTEYSDHLVERKNSEETGSSAYGSVLWGAGIDLKTKAFSVLSA